MDREVHIWPPISIYKLIKAYIKLKYTGSLKLVPAVDYRKLENSVRLKDKQIHELYWAMDKVTSKAKIDSYVNKTLSKAMKKVQPLEKLADISSTI